MLYVDRNGDGDLTNAGNRVSPTKGDSTDPAECTFLFEAGDLRQGTLLHKNLRVGVQKLDYLASQDDQAKALLASNPKARGYWLTLDVELTGWKGKGLGGRVEQAVTLQDLNGLLQFSDKPQETPIIHFAGPWQVTLDGRATADDRARERAHPRRRHARRWSGHDCPSRVRTTHSRDCPSHGGDLLSAATRRRSAVRERYEVKDRC